MNKQDIYMQKNSQGEQLRDEGMQAALSNADRSEWHWKDRAMSMLIKFVKEHAGKTFQAEDLRAWAYENGLPVPPSHRAWGGVIASARRQGIITHAGYDNVKNPLAHSTPASVWCGAI